MTTIQAGYRLTVISWENDGDNYNTKSIDGLTHEHCSLLVDLCKLHLSRSSFGNMYEANDAEQAAYREAIQTVLKENISTMDVDEAEDILYDLGLRGGEFYTRVLESFIVEFIPETIKLLDVTYEFE